MRWWFSFGWLCRFWGKRRKHRPGRRWVKYTRPLLEPLEDRRLFTNNVWLPQQLAPFDGTTQTNLAAQLFQPATTTVLPQLGLQGTSVTVGGQVSLSVSGNYALSLNQTGPYDGNGDRYTFTESGPVTFSLVELGSFSASGFSINSITLTQTASLSWSLVETNSSGQTLQNLSGLNTINVQSNGTAPFDPLFPAGFNWLSLTQQISSLNTLGLSNLAADAVSVTETNGSEGFTFQQTNGVATVQGNVQLPLSNTLLQSGQNSYTETAVEQFNSTKSGSDSFSLSELGQYSNNSYAFSNVSYQETGTQTSQFNATAVDSQSGTGSATGAQSFSGNNHALGGSSGESFQFSNLSTLGYGETANSNFTLTQHGSYGGGSFSLNSLTYNANGSGSYSLTQTSLQTQTGTFTTSGNTSGTDSYGIAGTLTGSGTVTSSGNFTVTSNGTLHDNESGNFTLSEGGAYGNASWSLSSFNLSESLSGTFSQQQLGTTTQSGLATATANGTGTDSFMLNYGAVVTTSGAGTVNSTNTQTDTFVGTSTNSSTYSGPSSYTLSQLGSLQGGVPALTSYVFSSGQSGTYTATGNASQTDNGTAQDSASGTDCGTQSSSYGGTQKSLLGSDNFSASDSFAFTSIDSVTTSDGGTFGQSAYQAGVFNNGSYALSSVSNNSTWSDSWSANSFDTNTDNGTTNFSDGGNGTNGGCVVLGGGDFTRQRIGSYSDNGGSTFSDTSTDSITSVGSSQFTLSQQGTYGNYSFSFNTSTYQATGTSNGTVQQTSNGSFSGNDLACSANGYNAGVQGSYVLSTVSGLATASANAIDSVGASGTNMVTETVTANDSWNVYAQGSFVGGSWSLSSVSYGESFAASFSLTQNDSATNSGTDTFFSSGTSTASGTTVYGGGSFTGVGTVGGTDSGTDIYSGQSNDTITGVGGNTFLLTQQGTFGAFSFAFSSMVYQGGDTATQTTLLSTSANSTGTDTGTSSVQGQSNGLGTYAASTNNASASLTLTSNYSFQTSGSNRFSETVNASQSDTFYNAGQYSGGSLALSSVSSNVSLTQTWSFTGGDTASDSGFVTQTANANASVQVALASVANGPTGSSANSFSAGSTLAGNAADTATESFSGGGNSTSSLSQQGTYGNFSYAFSNLVYQSGGTQTATVNETTANSLTGTLTNNGGSGGSYSRGLNGLVSLSLQASVTGSANVNLSETVNARSNVTTSSGDTWSVYQSGSYSGNSLSLSSVNVSDQGFDTWSTQGNATLTSAGPQTFGVGVSVALSVSVSNGSATTGNAETVSVGGTVSGIDTASANVSYNGNGGDTWSMSALGVYGNYSYSLGSVVLQGGGTYNGTFQSNAADTFQGSSTVNSSDNAQQSSGLSLGLALSSTNAQSSVSSNLTQTLQATNSAAGTITGNGSSSFYQGGSYAGGSFAFASVNYQSGGADTVTAVTTSTVGDTFGGNGTVGNSSGLSDTSNYASVECTGASAAVSVSGTLTGLQTQTASVTLTGSDNYSMTALGGYANFSYGLSNYVYSANTTLNVNAQETDTSLATWASAGSISGSGSQNNSAALAASSGGYTYPVNLNASSASTDSVSCTQTVNSTDTTTVTQAGTFNASLYQAGVYSAGSFALSSLVYNESSTSSSTTRNIETFASSDTRLGNASPSSDHQGQADNYTASNIETYTGQDTVSGGDTVTQTSLSTATLYEAGDFSNESYSLSSFALLQQGSDTVTSNAVSNASSTDSGSSSGEYNFSEAMIYQGSGTFADISGSNGTAQGTATDSWGLSEQGTFGNGSFAVTSYVFNLQQSSSASVVASGSWAETFSGSNQSQSYSGGDGGSFGGTFISSAGGSVSEQGMWANGSFDLSQASFSGSGSDSFSVQQSDGSSWSGGYSGSSTATSSASGNGSYTLSALGCYANGSWSLSQDVLQGGSSGSYSNSSSDRETLLSNSSMGGNQQNTSYNQVATGVETDSVYQSGLETAGVYSNNSYNVSSNESDTLTTTATSNRPAYYSGGDTWQDVRGVTVTGSGSSGSELETGSASYSWQSNGSGGVASGSLQSSPSVTLPGAAVVFSAPDGTSVPVAGAEQGGGDAPVAASLDESLVVTTNGWMAGEGQNAELAANHGILFAAAAAPPSQGSAPVGGGGLSGVGGFLSGAGSVLAGALGGGLLGGVSGAAPPGGGAGAPANSASGTAPAGGFWDGLFAGYLESSPGHQLGLRPEANTDKGWWNTLQNVYYLTGQGLSELAVTYLRDQLRYQDLNNRAGAAGLAQTPLDQSPIARGVSDAASAIWQGLNNVKQGFDDAPANFLKGLRDAGVEHYYEYKDGLGVFWNGPEAMRNQYESQLFRGMIRASDEGYAGKTGPDAMLRFFWDYQTNQVLHQLPFSGLISGFNEAVETGDWTNYQKASGDNAFWTLMMVFLGQLNFAPDEGGGGGNPVEGGGVPEGGGKPGGVPGGVPEGPPNGNIRPAAPGEGVPAAPAEPVPAAPAEPVPAAPAEPVPPGARAPSRGPTPPDVIAEEMGPGHFLDHGDPGAWKYLGKKEVPATGRGFPNGTKKVFEVFLDENGRQIEWHYWVLPDGTIVGGKIVFPGSTPRPGLSK